MTIDLLAELFRNLHAAADGGLHTASGVALGEFAWATYYEQALRAGQQAHAAGADPDSAFRDSMADSLGMSREEFDMLWNSEYRFDMQDAERWRHEVSDPLDAYFRNHGSR
jgi:hypothetical protein